MTPDFRMGGHTMYIDVPFMYLDVLLAGVVLLLRTSRRKEGEAIECVACGYNLTGNVSGICPECGAPAGQQAPPSDEVSSR